MTKIYEPNNPITGSADVVIRPDPDLIPGILTQIAALTDADTTAWRENNR